MTTLAALLYGDDAQATHSLTSQAPSLLAMSRASALGVVLPPVEIATAISKLLAMPVGNVALVAWDQQRRVRAARQQTRRHPGSREVVRLLEHTVTSKQNPTIDVEAGPVRGTLLTLTLQVEVAIGATDLVIEHGRVVEVHTGAATASAELSAGSTVLARRALVVVDLAADHRSHAA